MTREEAKDFMWIENDKNPTVIRWQHHSTISNLVSNLIDKIFDEHEAELKQAYIDGSNSNNGLIKFYLKQIEEKDKEIEKLISIVEEAIRKPMGIEPHSWSDYKIKKATT